MQVIQPVMQFSSVALALAGEPRDVTDPANRPFLDSGVCSALIQCGSASWFWPLAGEPRDVTDPANRPFLDSVARGECPAELEPHDRNQARCCGKKHEHVSVSSAMAPSRQRTLVCCLDRLGLPALGGASKVHLPASFANLHAACNRVSRHMSSCYSQQALSKACPRASRRR